MDIADEYGGKIGRFGKSHIGQVAIAQVDLGGAAGPFHDDEIGVVGELAKAVENSWKVARPGGEELACGKGFGAPALYDDLGAGTRLGLQQHWVHLHARRNSGSPCL